ncbi:MAG: MCE family protein [Desulfobacteraceae bacterium]|nr:MCE family protein [Desulfobacteraceae bacterium]
MTQKANFFKLGLFAIITFGLGAAFLIALGAGHFLQKETLAETCFNESVQGLDIGSEVKYRGVKIGTVKTITTPTKFYNIPSDYVLVIFSLSDDCYVGQTGETPNIRMKKAIAQNLSVYLAFKGLTGAAYLETDYAGQRTPLDITWQPKNLYVPSQKSTKKRLGDAITQITSNLSEAKFDGMAKNIKKLILTLNQKASALDVTQISNQTKDLLKEIRQTNKTLAATLTSENFTRLIADAQASFTGLKTIINNAKEPLDNTLKDFEKTAGNTKKITTKLEAGLTKNIDTMLKNLDKTSKMLKNMIWLNADTVHTTIENFEDTSENLKQLSIELKRYPGRLLFESPPKKNSPEKIKEEVKTDEN